MARYEDKFLIPKCIFDEIHDVFHTDKINFKNTYPQRIVKSIYYDTEDLFFARQNINGDGLRTKIRIRFYNDDLLNSNLEVKYKSFSVGKKFVKPFLLKEKLPDYKGLKLLLENLAEISYDYLPCISPKLLVSYTRKYWTSEVFDGVRVTLDSNIFIKELLNYDCLDNLNEYQLPLQDLCVLEIKYANYLAINNFVNHLECMTNLRRSRFSKYILGLIYTSQISLQSI